MRLRSPFAAAGSLLRSRLRTKRKSAVDAGVEPPDSDSPAKPTRGSANENHDRASYHALLGTTVSLLRTHLQIARYVFGASLLNHPNPLVLRGAKVYSQNEEDGITFEILRRIGLQTGTFAEFGVGNGTENNTLSLAAAGWRGFWVGAEDLAFNFNPLNSSKLNFHFQKAWIKRSNIVELFSSGLSAIGADQCDVISVDLDGNDYYFIDALLRAGIRPSLFIAEYNAKFIPPIKFRIDYDDEHRWNGRDYFGASLSSLVELFETHGYFLACCNITGSNAFFIRNTHREHFTDIPKETDLLYAAPKYFLNGLDVAGHPTSIATIEAVMKRLNPA
jgi:hypothetical protein